MRSIADPRKRITAAARLVERGHRQAFRLLSAIAANSTVPVDQREKAVQQISELGYTGSDVDGTNSRREVNHETLRHWVRSTERAERPGAVAESARDAELARLRKEVAELKLEREILRKAAAYFARETLD